MPTAAEKKPQRNHEDIEAIEMPLLAEAMFQRYGYDFRGYAAASLKRRMHHAMQAEGVKTISALQERVLHDAEAMARFLDIVSVDVTAMFRDPLFYRALRDKVAPALRALPHVRIWHAGSSTGEEVYSMAILLHEEGLLEKSQLYATDLNQRVLVRAKGGIFSLRHMQEYTANYQKTSGKGEFSQYYTAKHDSAILRDFLRGNIVWAQHNLVSDGSFNEFQMILCRNVMIYFGRPLQDRVHRLIYDSLAVNGVLCLGHGESLQFTPYEKSYEAVDRVEKIYRKIK